MIMAPANFGSCILYLLGKLKWKYIVILEFSSAFCPTAQPDSINDELSNHGENRFWIQYLYNLILQFCTHFNGWVFFCFVDVIVTFSKELPKYWYFCQFSVYRYLFLFLFLFFFLILLFYLTSKTAVWWDKFSSVHTKLAKVSILPKLLRNGTNYVHKEKKYLSIEIWAKLQN